MRHDNNPYNGLLRALAEKPSVSQLFVIGAVVSGVTSLVILLLLKTL